MSAGNWTFAFLFLSLMTSSIWTWIYIVPSIIKSSTEGVNKWTCISLEKPLEIEMKPKISFKKDSVGDMECAKCILAGLVKWRRQKGRKRRKYVILMRRSASVRSLMKLKKKCNFLGFLEKGMLLVLMDLKISVMIINSYRCFLIQILLSTFL